MSAVSEAVGRLLEDPGHRELLAALRTRLEAGGDPATVTVSGLSVSAQRALADLLGQPGLGGPVARVRLAEVDTALRSSRVGCGLIETLEAAGGPVANRRIERAQATDAWAALWEDLVGDPVVTGRAEAGAWLDGLRGDGLLARYASDAEQARVLAADALAVIARLPAAGTSLAALAAEVTGDAHALDHGEPLATLVLRAAALLAGSPGLPATARERRWLWAQAGVVCDPLSANVLVCGLLLDGRDVVAQAATDLGRSSQPARLTLRQLATGDWEPRRGTVLVCENPAVVAAAADRLGGEQPRAPLVCTEGMPDAAADLLLGRLAAVGCDVAFHADFDWGGVRIGAVLHRRYGARPWRFTAADYRAAVSSAARTRPLPRTAAEAPWDPDLAPTMRTTARAVVEEQLLDVLLDDIDAPMRPR